MYDSWAAEMRLVHVLPGRMRVHLTGWERGETGSIETRLLNVPGISRVHFNPLTANLLIHFDPAQLSPAVILNLLRTMQMTGTSSSISAAMQIQAAGAYQYGDPVHQDITVGTNSAAQRTQGTSSSFGGAPRRSADAFWRSRTHRTPVTLTRVPVEGPLGYPVDTWASGYPVTHTTGAMRLVRIAFAIVDALGALTVAEIAGMLTRDLPLVPLIARVVLGSQRAQIALSGSAALRAASRQESHSVQRQVLQGLITVVKICVL